MSTVAVCPDCGWRSKPTTEGLARKGLLTHSCDKHRRLLASRARGEARRAAVDRNPKPCLHKNVEHEHGTHACYALDRCRCAPCTAANSAYEHHRSRQAAYGRWQPWADPQPARDHIAALADAGIGLKTVAKRAGVAHGSLCKIVYGVTRPDGSRTPTQRIRPAVAARILAVQPGIDTVADSALVSAIGVHRRVQALVAAGWSQAKIAGRLGILTSNFGVLMHRANCNAKTHRAVRALYDELATVPPPEATWRDKIAASRARNYAAGRGWQPPAWWDVEWFDDPTWHPSFVDDGPLGSHEDVDEVVVDLACAGRPPERLTIAERREVVRRLHGLRLSDRQIAARSGISERGVWRIRQELGLPAIEAVA